MRKNLPQKAEKSFSQAKIIAELTRIDGVARIVHRMKAMREHEKGQMIDERI
jgi:hypothetical protein